MTGGGLVKTAGSRKLSAGEPATIGCEADLTDPAPARHSADIEDYRVRLGDGLAWIASRRSATRMH
jgi:hypothetical protein